MASDQAVELPGQQGAADKFTDRYGDRFGYVASWGRYVAWDGKRWSTENGNGQVRKLWQRHLRKLVREAADAPTEAQPEALREINAMAGAAYENAMLTLCQSRRVLDLHTLDAEPYVLNCKSGVLDLRDGKLYRHAPSERCTRLAPVAWEPEARCPKWLAYLDWAMEGDAQRVRYLQRFFGLCLTGDAEHELAHFFWGGGGNGKTTVIKTIEAVLGDYAGRAPARMLMYRKHESHPTELANLHGRRLVTFAETNEAQTLDEQMLKQVASKDPISARRMREDFWSFRPTHKAVLLTNNKPRVRGQDEGVWRRIVLVEWGASVSDAEKDAHFGDRFTPELPGILRWAWKGLQEVLRDGLRPPKGVREATDGYRTAEDSVPQWIESDCVTGGDSKAGAGELYASYSRWAEQHFGARLTQTAFGRRLDALGYAGVNLGGHKRGRRGLSLRWG